LSGGTTAGSGNVVAGAATARRRTRPPERDCSGERSPPRPSAGSPGAFFSRWCGMVAGARRFQATSRSVQLNDRLVRCGVVSSAAVQRRSVRGKNGSGQALYSRYAQRQRAGKPRRQGAASPAGPGVVWCGELGVTIGGGGRAARRGWGRELGVRWWG